MDTTIVKKQIIEFAGNTPPKWIITNGKPDKTKVATFLQDPNVLSFVNSTLGLKIRKLKPGPVYECAVKLITNFNLDKKKFTKKHKIYAKKSIIPDAYNSSKMELSNYIIPSGPIEIKGFSHGETGTADEKNLGIVCKYLYYPYESDDKLTVILCGHITAVNKLLIDQTLEYQNWLNDDTIEHTLMPICLKEFWKQAQFNGFLSFDTLNTESLLINFNNISI